MPDETFSHSTELSVRFAETDAQGIAHNASYLVWYEVARVDYLIERVTESGAEPVADGWTLHATVDHESLRPTRLPEWLREAIEQAEAQTAA